MEVIRFFGTHANRVATAVRAGVYMAVVLNWWQLAPEQQLAVIGFAEAVLGVFVDANVVPKTRVGARITEEVRRIVDNN